MLVEVNDEGKFHQATAVMHVNAPISVAWGIVTDFGKYKDFMPNLVVSSPTRVSKNFFDVEYEVEVPGLNPDYIFRHEIRKDTHEVLGTWKDGDLEDSYSKWRLVEHSPKETLLYYTTASRNFSAMAQALEDDQQTITVGVNVSAALATVKAITPVRPRPSDM